MEGKGLGRSQEVLLPRVAHAGEKGGAAGSRHDLGFRGRTMENGERGGEERGVMDEGEGVKFFLRSHRSGMRPRTEPVERRRKVAHVKNKLNNRNRQPSTPYVS
jgi:hypothetical protein